MKAICLQLDQFSPSVSPGGNVRPSEIILRPLLEIVAWMNCVQLTTNPNIAPLYEYVKRGLVRYQREPTLQEWARQILGMSPRRTAMDDGVELFNGIKQVLRDGVGDCFPMGTLLLRDGMELTTVDEVKVGDRIWGEKEWSTIEAKSFKGRLSVDAIHMNNGSTVCLTPDHHVYVGRCSGGELCKKNGKYGCSCSESNRVYERIRVSELKPYDVLMQPERIPFGTEEQDPDRALVEGFYISDGWSSDQHAFEISGQDGCPKEEQKREVERICERLGISTHWHRKYISVKNKEWTLRMQQMGHYAPNKHALSLNLTEGPAASLLRGIMADSGKNTNGPGRTFTTTSRLLAIQTRVLHRMFGLSAGYRYVENHGGLGENPVYRLGIRARDHQKLLRVKSITRNAFTAPCWDIQTSDHRVYLPEHDITVSQCDDLCSWRVAELRVRGSLPYYPNGEPADFVITKYDASNDQDLLYHIQVRRAPTPEHPNPRDPFLVEDPSALAGMASAVGLPQGHTAPPLIPPIDPRLIQQMMIKPASPLDVVARM